MAKRLTQQQLYAIELLSLPKKGNMTYEQIAEKVGVSSRTIQRWRNDDTFYQAYLKKVMRDSAEKLPDIMASVPQHIINEGNAAMFRTLIQAYGLLTDKVEIKSKDNDASDIDALRKRAKELREDKATDEE